MKITWETNGCESESLDEVAYVDNIHFMPLVLNSVNIVVTISKRDDQPDADNKVVVDVNGIEHISYYSNDYSLIKENDVYSTLDSTHITDGHMISLFDRSKAVRTTYANYTILFTTLKYYDDNRRISIGICKRNNGRLCEDNQYAIDIDTISMTSESYHCKYKNGHQVGRELTDKIRVIFKTCA